MSNFFLESVLNKSTFSCNWRLASIAHDRERKSQSAKNSIGKVVVATPFIVHWGPKNNAKLQGTDLLPLLCFDFLVSSRAFMFLLLSDPLQSLLAYFCFLFPGIAAYGKWERRVDRMVSAAVLSAAYLFIHFQRAWTHSSRETSGLLMTNSS